MKQNPNGEESEALSENNLKYIKARGNTGKKGGGNEDQEVKNKSNP